MNRFYDEITEFIFVENEPARSDIIFVPGGNYPDAARKAAKLYQEGYSDYILPSGRFSIRTGHFEGRQETEWEYLKDILLEEGVPEKAILKEDRATFTYENAIFSRKAADRAGLAVKRAILCCQAFHARRALMYYQQQFPEAQFLVCPAVTQGISRDTWFLDQHAGNRVLGELTRIGEQFHCMLPLTPQEAEEADSHPPRAVTLDEYRKKMKEMDP